MVWVPDIPKDKVDELDEEDPHIKTGDMLIIAGSIPKSMPDTHLYGYYGADCRIRVLIL